MGRPSEFSSEAADEICERLARGESLRAICSDEESGWLPSERTVHRWLNANEEFRQQYVRAREVQADTLVDEIIDIADGKIAVTLGKEEVLSDPTRDRLRMDARKWVASKLAPKKYGEAVQMKHTDADGGPVQQVIRWAKVEAEATPDPSKS